MSPATLMGLPRPGNALRWSQHRGKRIHGNRTRLTVQLRSLWRPGAWREFRAALYHQPSSVRGQERQSLLKLLNVQAPHTGNITVDHEISTVYNDCVLLRINYVDGPVIRPIQA